MSYILVVDDDTKLRNLIQKYLHNNNYQCLVAPSAKIARQYISENKVSLIILDVMMPEESGINFAASLRKTSNIPILMLSALSDPEHRINGLEIGADDYLTKPFEPRELLLRINNLLQRNNSYQKQIAVFGKFKFNFNNYRLYRNEIIVDLSSTETKLLYLLIKNINKPVNRDDIARENFGINERSTDVQIARLRQKIEEDPKNPKHIITMRNQGYALITE